MKLFLLAVLLSGSSWAGSFTAKVSGNWNNAATWGGASIPGNGDTVFIKDGVTVTVTDLRIVGASGVNGTIAVNCNNSGALIIASGGTLQLRGDIQYAANGGGNTLPYLTVQGGGILEFDSSQVRPSPSATKYAAHQDSEFGFRPFVTAGTSTSHAIVRSNAGGGNGYFSLGGNPIGGSYRTTYTGFLRIGDSINPAFSGGNWVGTHTVTTWIATHDTFTSCGMAPFYGLWLVGEDVFQHDYNVHIGSVGATVMHRPGDPGMPPICTAVGTPAGCTSIGAREILANVFDIAVDTTFDARDFTIHSNYFGGGNFGTVNSATHTWNIFQNNFYRIPTPRLGEPMTLMGDSRDNYWLWDESDSYNPHGPNLGAASNETLTGNIIDHAGQIALQTSAFMIMNVPLFTNGMYTLRNNIFLPNMAGNTSFWATGLTTCCGQGGVTFNINHNTVMSNSVLSGDAVIDGHSGIANSAGEIASYQNNILWNPVSSNQSYKLDNIGASGNLNVCSPRNCDYNDGWNMRTDGGGHAGGAHGYADNFSGGMPGAHDLAVDPMFVDPTRNMATFDSAYLGNVQPAWSSSATYSVGAMVSSADPTIYNNTPINYRYTAGPGCAGAVNPKPGLMGGIVSVTSGSPTVTWVSGAQFQSTWTAGSPVTLDYIPYTLASVSGNTLTLTANYAGSTHPNAIFMFTPTRACWEWASLYRIRQAVAAQTLDDDQDIGAHGVDIITVLIQWVRAGFSPTVEALALAGSDGQDIGAVPVTFEPLTPSHRLRGPRRGPAATPQKGAPK